jgi:hypothetical protein
MKYFLNSILHPDNYHGHGKKKTFFEGWYYKVISADERHRYAFIPGVILGENGHAFVQVLEGLTGNSLYFTYPLETFWASKEDFDIHIGPNHFTQDRIEIRVENERSQISGELDFTGLTPWPITMSSPGIMGWYAWVPFMECYHGVVSLDHRINGKLNVNNEMVDYSGGRGYIEKDWGQSFPDAWIWFQSNHFNQPGTSLTASVAIIPWLGSAFRGFIIGFWFNGKLYRFATYTGSRVDQLEVDDDQVSWVVSDQQYQLRMVASREEGAVILGPTKQDMSKRVAESLDAIVNVRLSDLSGEVIFEGIGRIAGLEVSGNIERLLIM